jgi:hypothetical protein
MTDRTRGARSVLAIAAFAAALSATPAALAAPASVNLRVEGRSSTIFEGAVTTDGHDVNTQTTPTPHKCDGTNGPSPEPQAGPTALGALDDAARLGAFTWDGEFFPSFDDYLVSRVAGDTASGGEFWGLYKNLSSTSEGGCQTRVRDGDEVLWALSATHDRALKLTGPADADTGQPVSMRVTDGGTGAPQPGATVNGVPTGPDGRATLAFQTTGIYRLKAEKPGSIRSKAIALCVDPPGADACTSGDKLAPALTVRIPGGFASDGGQSRTIVVSWQGDDSGTGSGIRTYGVDVQEVNDGARASAAPYRNLREGITRTSVHFRGDSGSSYRFRVRATDRANNTGQQVSGIVSIPIDDRDRRLMKLRGWKRVAKKGAWGRFVVRPKKRGATVRLRFRGRRVALVGRKLAKGGRLRVSVQGKSKVIRVRGKSGPRTVLWTSRRIRAGTHTLRIRAVGGPAELDAVAPLP